jgi:hypothetical protein
MADDLKRRRPEDPTKINKNQDWEIKYWTQELGVSEPKLRSAIQAVGPLVKNVKQYLNK